MKDYWCELNETIRNSMKSMNVELMAEKHAKDIGIDYVLTVELYY